MCSVSPRALIFKSIYYILAQALPKFSPIPPNNVLLKIKDVDVVWKKEGPGFFFFPQWPYLWVSDGGRDVYMNLTQTAGTSWVCKYQPANFMRTELIFSKIGWGADGRAGGRWLRFPVLPVLEPLDVRQKLYFKISVPGPSWNLDPQMYTKKGTRVHTVSHTHTYTNTHKGALYRLPKLVYFKHTQYFSIKKRWSQISKYFIKAFQSFETEEKSNLIWGKRFCSLLFNTDWPNHAREKERTHSTQMYPIKARHGGGTIQRLQHLLSLSTSSPLAEINCSLGDRGRFHRDVTGAPPMGRGEQRQLRSAWRMLLPWI